MKKPCATEWSTHPPVEPGIYFIGSRLVGIKLAKVFPVAQTLYMQVTGHEPTRLHALTGWWWLPAPVDVPCLPSEGWEA